MTNSQSATTNESQQVSPFPAGDHKAHINRRSQRHSKHQTEKKQNIFHLKFIINGSTFILKQVIFHFLMEMFLAPLLMHKRRKLFKIGGGGGGAARPTSILGGGGGIAKSTYTHACTCTHTHVLNIHTPTHACSRMCACMHSLCKHTFYILI